MNTKKNKTGSRPCDRLPLFFMEVYLIKDFSKAKHNTKDNNRKLDSSGMDIPDYAYERMAKCLLPIRRAYFESEDGKTTLLNLEEDGENGYAA